MSIADTAQLMGNFGEFVGAIAVVVTLGYLAVQIRQQNHESRQLAMHNVSEGFRAAAGRAIDIDFAEVAVRGFADFNSLSDAEKYAVMTLFINIFRVGEEAFILHAQGRLDERYWWGFERYFSSIISLPGAKSIWGLRRHYFHEEFQVFVDQLEPSEWRLEQSTKS